MDAEHSKKESICLSLVSAHQLIWTKHAIKTSELFDIACSELSDKSPPSCASYLLGNLLAL